MKRTKRVEITIETSRTVVRRGVGDDTVWCARCSALAQPVTPEEAATLAGLNTAEAHHQAETGRLHFIETAESSPLLCWNSLLASFDAGGDDDAEDDRGDRFP